MFDKKDKSDFNESNWWLAKFMFRKLILRQKAFEVWSGN